MDLISERVNRNIPCILVTYNTDIDARDPANWKTKPEKNASTQLQDSDHIQKHHGNGNRRHKADQKEDHGEKSGLQGTSIG